MDGERGEQKGEQIETMANSLYTGKKEAKFRLHSCSCCFCLQNFSADLAPAGKKLSGAYLIHAFFTPRNYRFVDPWVQFESGGLLLAPGLTKKAGSA